MIISWIGLILGLGGIVMGQLLEGGHLVQLLQPTAAMIVFGGTLGATMLSTTMSEFSHALRAVRKVFFSNPRDHMPLIKEIVTNATVARKEGILGLESHLKNIRHPFLATSLRHLIDGYDPAVLKEMMEERIYKETEDRMGIARVWEVAGGYAPTVGIIGAVLGLIHVMSNLSDSSKLGAGIAVAFVATVYGVGSANLVFLPLANKIKRINQQELEEFSIIYTGVLGLQSGLNPRVIEEKLYNLIGDQAPEGRPGAGGFAEKKAA